MVTYREHKKVFYPNTPIFRRLYPDSYIIDFNKIMVIKYEIHSLSRYRSLFQLPNPFKAKIVYV